MGDGGQRRNAFVFYWLPVVLYATLILAVSSIPPSRLEPLELSGWDKAAHAVEYAILSVLLSRALRGAGPGRLASSAGATALVAILVTGCFAALDEAYQSRTGRDPDPYDALADGAGAVLAQAIIVRRERRRSEKL